jgi:hypothetical protein
MIGIPCTFGLLSILVPCRQMDDSFRIFPNSPWGSLCLQTGLVIVRTKLMHCILGCRSHWLA